MNSSKQTIEEYVFLQMHKCTQSTERKLSQCCVHFTLTSAVTHARWQRWINFGLQCSAGLFHCVNVLFFDVGFLLSYFLFYFVTLHLLILLIILLPVLTRLWLFAPSSLVSLGFFPIDITLLVKLSSCMLVLILLFSSLSCLLFYLLFVFSWILTFFVC